MTDSQHDHLREGLRLFNAEEFFACHDVLEALWTETLGEQREFYQGLIHASVALFHFSEGNLGGARKMYHTACRYLQPYAPQYMGLDVGRFLADLRRCFQELLGAEGDYPFHVTLCPERIPKIRIPDT